MKNSNSEEKISKSKAVLFVESLEYLFFWVRWFYPKAGSISLAYLMYTFFLQKVMRINGTVPWPMHFTSSVNNYKKIELGDASAPGLSGGCYIQAKNGIHIGSNLRMGPNVGLISANHDPDDYDKWLPARPIKIGDNVWLGMGVVVMPGVCIGDNVIVAANAVVSSDLDSDAIYGGIPAKFIKAKSPYKSNSQ